MFFRPEEKHGTSGVRDIRSPFGYGNGYIADQSFRIGLFDDAVTHFDGDRFSAIETWGVDANLLPRKQPADRQRFEGSLREPLLFAFNGDAELGGLIVERGERGDKIRIWKQPAVNSGPLCFPSMMIKFALLNKYRSQSDFS
jgi:hypothetical protein